MATNKIETTVTLPLIFMPVQTSQKGNTLDINKVLLVGATTSVTIPIPCSWHNLHYLACQWAKTSTNIVVRKHAFGMHGYIDLQHTSGTSVTITDGNWDILVGLIGRKGMWLRFEFEAVGTQVARVEEWALGKYVQKMKLGGK